VTPNSTMNPTSVIVGSPTITAPSLVSWLPVADLQRLFPDIYRAARPAYAKQRYCAGERGIVWQFVFATWWIVWSKSGRWSERGRGIGKWCMSRPGDTGPYSETNTAIIPFVENGAEGGRHLHTEASIAKMRLVAPARALAGWARRRAEARAE
jgi:hypothetical protein